MGNVKMKFKDSPIGARFKYPGVDRIWVKLNSYPNSDGLICSWAGNIEGIQEFCSFTDEENGVDFDTEVELI